MKVVVTGAGGQLGRALGSTAPRGIDMFAIDRAAADFTQPAALARVIETAAPDLVINAAAYTAVDKAESEPELAKAVNHTAVAALVDVTNVLGIPLIHLSTDFVFDGRSGHAYAPDTPTAPLGVYAASKRDGEVAALTGNSRSLVVRTAWLYSENGGNFVRTMLRLMAERESLRVVADQIGTPTYAPSLARALWALSASKAPGIHHFTDAGAASWYDFAVAIQEEALALGILPRAVPIDPIPSHEYPTPARRPAFSVLDCFRTWAITGTPPHWRDQLRAMLQEVKAHG